MSNVTARRRVYDRSRSPVGCLLILRTLGIIEFWSNTNNRASGNRKKSLMGIWKRLSVNRPSNHRVVLFAYIFPSTSLLSRFSFSSLFPLARASLFLSTPVILRSWKDLPVYSTYVDETIYSALSFTVYTNSDGYIHIHIYVHTRTSARWRWHRRCCEEDTFTDWRFSYLIVDCHAKARTSYWLGILSFHPLVLGARVCLPDLETPGKYTYTRGWFGCVFGFAVEA